MKVKINDNEYTGLLGLLVAIPCAIIIGIFFLAVGVALTAPLWVPLALLSETFR